MGAERICDDTVDGEEIRPVLGHSQIHHRRVQGVRVCVAQIHDPLSLIHVQDLVLLGSRRDQRGMIPHRDPVGLFC